MEVVNIYEAKTQLSKLINRVLDGERIVIARAGKPLVDLTPHVPAEPRKPGAWKGKVWMSDDFNDPIPELEAAIYGDD